MAEEKAREAGGSCCGRWIACSECSEVYSKIDQELEDSEAQRILARSDDIYSGMPVRTSLGI